MKIIAVVVTYNRLELLKKSVAALQAQRQLSGIIVVDNGATDGTHEWLDTLVGQSKEANTDDTQPQKSFRVIHQENVGGSGGFYTGIQAAYDDGADWIWCMDDDVFPRKDCLDNLLKHINAPNAGILSPRRILDGKVFSHEFQKFNFSNPFASMHGDKVQSSEFKVQSSEFKVQSIKIAGCDFEGPFINRKVVEKIGLPNKELFIFCDDTDYCLRANLAGFSIYYIPDALMDKHKFFSNDTWTTRNQKKKWKRYYQVRNETYMSHHYGQNWAVRYLRGFIMVMGYWIPALLSMPFTNAWKMSDLPVLWQAYKDGINERLGKR